jgi:hypothetical protein
LLLGDFIGSIDTGIASLDTYALELPFLVSADDKECFLENVTGLIGLGF